MLEHLGVELLLGVVGLAAEFTPKVCSGHRFRPEGTHATGQAGFLCPWILLVPVTPSGVGTDVVFYSPVILRSWCAKVPGVCVCGEAMLVQVVYEIRACSPPHTWQPEPSCDGPQLSALCYWP